MSSSCQAVIRQCCQAVIRQFLGNQVALGCLPEVIRQLLGCHQAVTRQSSDSSQAVVRHWSCSCQAVILQLVGRVVKQLTTWKISRCNSYFSWQRLFSSLRWSIWLCIQRWSLYYQHRKNNLIVGRTNILIFCWMKKRKKVLGTVSTNCDFIPFGNYSSLLWVHHSVIRQSVGSCQAIFGKKQLAVRHLSGSHQEIV